jgi:hypothetical protein
MKCQDVEALRQIEALGMRLLMRTVMLMCHGVAGYHLTSLVI